VPVTDPIPVTDPVPVTDHATVRTLPSDVSNPGKWMMRCHFADHLATGTLAAVHADLG
jgi:FtsP/CotA-like multicopper oxidase with cupredoxin domain